MAMDTIERNAFDSYIREGDWHLSLGETRENSHYYNDARDHYYKAKEKYDTAFNIARYADDQNGESEADNKSRLADDLYRSISRKEWEYNQKQKENDCNEQ